MAITPGTLARHELIGLRARVVEAANPDLVGVNGRVVDETMGTLVLAGDERDRTVPKRGTTIEFALDDGYAVVEGVRLVARPERRTENGGGSIWQSA